MADILKIRGAAKRFSTPDGKAVQALDHVDLDVKPSEFVTLLGPSGCGKTTLLRAISGFEALDSGSIILDGEDIASVPAFKRPVNTVFQSYALFSHMSVARNVGYSLEIRGINRADRERSVTRALETVGLTGMEFRKPSQLSGGQRQRVALARAIVAKPKLLLLDEPLSALDRNLRKQMQIELKSLQSELGITFVFVTHDQEEALTMSDRVVVMRSGKIEQIGTPRDIYRKPGSRFVASFVGETNIFSGTVTSLTRSKAKLTTEDGLTLDVAPQGRRKGETITAVLRPSDFQLADRGLAATVSKVIYAGSDVHLHVSPPKAGQLIFVTCHDGEGLPKVGDMVRLAHDPNDAHVLEEGAAP